MKLLAGFKYRKLWDYICGALILALVIYTGNASSPVRALLLIPVIIMCTTRSKRWGIVTATAAGLYLLIASLLVSHGVSSLLFLPNAIFGGVMVLVAWLVGGGIDMERDARLNLVGVNQELERVVSERTREMTLANHELSAETTQRLQIENQLKKSEARFRSIFANTSVGVALIDRNQAFVMVNEAFCNFLGFSSQEILYKKVAQFVLLDEDILEKTLNDSLVDAGQRLMEQRFVRKDGELVWGRLNIAQVKDEQGTCRHLAIICENVTAMKMKESELQAHDQIYEEMHGALQDLFKAPGQPGASVDAGVDTAPVPVVPPASPYSVSYEDAVACRVIEVAREITGATWVEYFSYNSDTRMLCLTGNAGMPQELFLRAKTSLRYGLDEERGFVSLAARQCKSLHVPELGAEPEWMKLDAGIQSGYLVPVHYRETLFGVYVLVSKQTNGFSEQQRTMADALVLYISTSVENARLFGEVQRAFERINNIQEQLLQSQKMDAIGQLAGGIAHDLNNQLTVIQASVDMNANLVPEDGSLGKAFKRIRLATEKSANLIRHLLLFGRKHPQFKVLFDLNLVVRELQEMLEHLLGDQMILLELAPDLWPVYADAINIEQVIINLAINARDAIQEGGMIAVKTENAVFDQTTTPPARGSMGNFVCLSVSDTGTGIEEQHLSHIFEPFFTTKESGKGTGLGLSIAYGIVDAHGGWIDVTSKSGAGSTFRVYLPAIADDENGEPEVELYPVSDTGDRSLASDARSRKPNVRRQMMLHGKQFRRAPAKTARYHPERRV